eukprot:123344-Hanusia_phi.AAC.2
MLSPDASRWIDVEASLLSVVGDDNLEALTLMEDAALGSSRVCDVVVEGDAGSGCLCLGAPPDLSPPSVAADFEADRELDHNFFVVFAGETLGNLTRGR